MEANIKTILLAVQQRLAERVPELAYIDKNWGQLDYEAPPVKWPCALLDIDEVPFSQIGGGGQIADGVTVEILAANLRLVSSSAAAPRKADAYLLIELLDKIHSALQRFTDGTFGPIFRTQIKKIAAVRAGECYKVLYQTAYTLPGVQEGQSAKLPPSSIRLEMR